jgi:anti-anti-sigma regulatory factor
MTSVHPVFGSPRNLRTIFLLRGAVDATTVDDMRTELMRFAAGTTGDVVIDCRGLDSIDTAGTDLLLQFHNDLLGFARRVSVRRIPASCRAPFEEQHLTALLGEETSKRARSR